MAEATFYMPGLGTYTAKPASRLRIPERMSKREVAKAIANSFEGARPYGEPRYWTRHHSKAVLDIIYVDMYVRDIYGD